MSKLTDLYTSIRTLKDMGVELDKLNEQLNSLEEELIRTEVLPVLKESIEPALSEVERDLVLVVEYHPDSPIAVKLSRDGNVSKRLQDVIEITPAAEHNNAPKSGNGQIKRAPATGLNVYFPDGTYIHEKLAATTICQAIYKLGIEKTAALNIIHEGQPLVSKAKQTGDNAEPHKVGSTGYYVNTHSSTLKKKRLLEQIANALNIQIEVVVVDKQGNIVG